MKNFFNSFLVVVFIFLFGWGLLKIIECGTKDPSKIEMVSIPKVTWDSIQILAKKPPVIHIDTFKIPGKIVYVPIHKPTPKPLPVIDSTAGQVVMYSDSLVNDSINVWADIFMKDCIIEGINWSYKPLITQINVEKKKYVPQIVEKPYEAKQRHLYGYGLGGLSGNLGMYGFGLDYFTKKNMQIGIGFDEILLPDNSTKNVFTFKIGFRIF